MESQRPAQPEIVGELSGPDGAIPVQVIKSAHHTLFVRFPGGHVIPNRAEFSALKLSMPSRELSFGRSRYHSHAENPSRRKDDPPLVGDGKLVFLDDLYDFSALTRTGAVVELKKRLDQLPMLWSRKNEVRPEFREFTAELLYDLQVYRGLFDEIDRNLQQEPFPIRTDVHRVVTQAEYPSFVELFDQKLAEMEAQVKGFNQEEHERHGFYFRKHVWDLIRSSEFLMRTNLKPRGYAGDSQMMRLLYEDDFRGSTIFARFMHRHPVQSAAAQAVRNRVKLLSERITRLGATRSSKNPARLMSVAAGPAWELREVFGSREDFERYEVSLLDQDPEALGEARAMLTRLESQHQTKAKVRYIQESVRTMMRTANLATQWGRFDFVYSMGLFDYLTAPVAKVVLTKLYDLLEPGGELVIGNFHISNPTRLYMEYWMDWVLLYRSEDEFRELAEGLEGAQTSVVFEDTRSQMFLCVRKGG